MQFIIIILLMISLTIENCGFHLKYKNNINLVLKLIECNPNNYYNDFIVIIKYISNLNNIEIINDNNHHNNIVVLKILNILEESKIISISNNGQDKEKQLILILHTEIIYNNLKNYKIKIIATRTIFENSLGSLYSNIEYEYLKKEMYKEIADKLIHNILLYINKVNTINLNKS